MKVLITGANGQVGTQLLKLFPEAIAVDVGDFDITDAQSYQQFNWSELDAVINAAAYTNVDAAETDGYELAWKVNALGPALLARVADKHQLPLVHISTDYVFDGTQEIHSENEPFSPLSVYGASKAAGDIAAAQAKQHYILRTSWVIGDGPNFVKTMIGLAEKDVSPSVVSDQIGRPTFTVDLAAAIKHLLDRDADYGTYNVTNDGEPVGWADITRQIYTLLERDDLSVSDTSTKEYFADKPNSAPRPLQSTLELAKIKSTGFTPRDWQEALNIYLTNFMEA